MAAKTGPAYKMSNTHRDKIKNSNILNALIEHAEGIREMQASQVTAGLGLLDRIMPKLAAVTVEGGENPIKTEEVGQGASKLAAYLDAISERTSGDPAGQ